MSIFSEKLSRLMDEKGVTAYKLEKLGFLKRTTILKYANGKSKPPDNASLEELIRMMALGPEEAEDLREAYAITKIGEPIYFRRKHVEDLLKVINTAIAYPFDWHRHSSLHLKRDVECITGRVNVANIISIVLTSEAEKASPSIKVIAQPEGSRELMSCLTTLTSAESAISLEHVFCIDNRSANYDNAYNINLLKEIMPLIVSGASYTPYYYYDDVRSHINQFSSFPTVIITSSHAMLVSYDLEKAVISGLKDFTELQNMIFEGMKKRCDTYVRALPGPLDILSYYENVVDGADNIIPDFSVMPDPCLFPFLDEDIIDKYARFDLPNIDKAVALLKDRLRRYREGMEKKLR